MSQIWISQKLETLQESKAQHSDSWGKSDHNFERDSNLLANQNSGIISWKHKHVTPNSAKKNI